MASVGKKRHRDGQGEDRDAKCFFCVKCLARRTKWAYVTEDDGVDRHRARQARNAHTRTCFGVPCGTATESFVETSEPSAWEVSKVDQSSFPQLAAKREHFACHLCDRVNVGWYYEPNDKSDMLRARQARDVHCRLHRKRSDGTVLPVRMRS